MVLAVDYKLWIRCCFCTQVSNTWTCSQYYLFSCRIILQMWSSFNINKKIYKTTLCFFSVCLIMLIVKNTRACNVYQLYQIHEVSLSILYCNGSTSSCNVRQLCQIHEVSLSILYCNGSTVSVLFRYIYI